MKKRIVRILAGAIALTVAAGCGESGSLTQVKDETVILGKVSIALGADASVAAVQGIAVSIDGAAETDVTDATGSFRLALHGDRGPHVLRLHRGSMDSRIPLAASGAPVLQVGVSVGADGATLASSSAGRGTEFEGRVSTFEVEGDAPTRALALVVVEGGRTEAVRALEDGTSIDPLGDLATFDELLAALEAGGDLEVEGRGERADDGTVVAATLKAETDEDDDHDGDDHDHSGPGHGGEVRFEGIATLVASGGEAPARTVTVDVDDLSGTTTVEIVEGVTLLDHSGDLTTFGALVAELVAGEHSIELKGEADWTDGGTLVATEIRAEIEDDEAGHDDGDGDEPAQDDDEDFHGIAAFVSLSGDEPSRTLRVELTSDSGSTLLLDVLEETTAFDPDGDLLTFAALVGALDRADVTVRIEGFGDTRADRTVVATDIKVETDD